MELEAPEDNVAGFLEIHIDRKKDGKITLTQLGLTNNNKKNVILHENYTSTWFN